MQQPTLCLNMIVKNESKIITRLFDSVLPIIDCYSCDSINYLSSYKVFLRLQINCMKINKYNEIRFIK